MLLVNFSSALFQTKWVPSTGRRRGLFLHRARKGTIGHTRSISDQVSTRLLDGEPKQRRRPTLRFAPRRIRTDDLRGMSPTSCLCSTDAREELGVSDLLASQPPPLRTMTPFGLHVSDMPLAFIQSQDQTLLYYRYTSVSETAERKFPSKMPALNSAKSC